MKTKLPNKIKNLNLIKNLLLIPEYYYFNFESYKKNKYIIIKKIQKKFKNKIILRSAKSDEDTNISNAGKYLSISKIDTKNYKEIVEGIEKVFHAYGKIKKNEFLLVQEYIENSNSVGVIFTADQKNGCPFRTINYTDTNSTDLITSGKSNGKIYYYFKDIKKIKLNKKIKKIENTIKKLENKFSNTPLDIEFLILKKKIYILQVRKLNIQSNKKKSKKIFNKKRRQNV